MRKNDLPQYNIIPFPEEFNVHPSAISDIINDSISDVNPLFSSIPFFFKQGEDDIPSLLYNAGKEGHQFAFCISSAFPEAYVRIIKLLTDGVKLSVRLQFQIIDCFLLSASTSPVLYELFKICGWPSSKRGLEMFLTLKETYRELQDLVLDEKAALHEAILFHRILGESGKSLINLLPLKMSFSERNQCLELAVNILRKYSISVDELIKEIDKDNSKNILKILHNLLYSSLLQYREKLDAYLGDLQLPKSVKIHYDADFENHRHTFQATFSSLKELKSVLTETLSRLNMHDENDDILDFKEYLKGEE